MAESGRLGAGLGCWREGFRAALRRRVRDLGGLRVRVGGVASPRLESMDGLAEAQGGRSGEGNDRGDELRPLTLTRSSMASKSAVSKALLLSLLVGCASAFANVFGKDDRVPLKSSEWPWRTLGRVVNGTGTHGTGALVGPNLVLTNAHVVLNEKNGVIWQDLGFVVPDPRNNGDGPAYASTKRAQAQVVALGTHFPRTTETRCDDWAIIDIKTELGKKCGTLGVAPRSVSEIPDTITLGGFSSDVNFGQTGTVHFDGHVRKRFPKYGVIYHDCDMTEGCSGGPILANINNELKIVGLNAASVESVKGRENYDEYSDECANLALSSDRFYAIYLDLLTRSKAGEVLTPVDRWPPKVSPTDSKPTQASPPSSVASPVASPTNVPSQTPPVTLGASQLEISNGQSLPTGQRLSSKDGSYYLVCQSDGNLVVYKTSDNSVSWSTGTSAGPVRLELEPGGGLVLRETTGREVWRATGVDSDGAENSKLRLGTNGILYLVNLQNGFKVRWSSR